MGIQIGVYDHTVRLLSESPMKGVAHRLDILETGMCLDCSIFFSEHTFVAM